MSSSAFQLLQSIKANVDNETLSDADFRAFVRRSLPLVVNDDEPNYNLWFVVEANQGDAHFLVKSLSHTGAKEGFVSQHLDATVDGVVTLRTYVRAVGRENAIKEILQYAIGLRKAETVKMGEVFLLPQIR